MNPVVKQRLSRHLDNCISELDLDLRSRPDSGPDRSPRSITSDGNADAASPGALEATTSYCNSSHNITLPIETEVIENVGVSTITRSNDSASNGDENNNDDRSTVEVNSTSLPGFEQSLRQHDADSSYLMKSLDIGIGSELSEPCIRAFISQQQRQQERGGNILSVIQVFNTRILISHVAQISKNYR